MSDTSTDSTGIVPVQPDYNDMFSQDGVLLKSAPASHLAYINTIGTLYITEYTGTTKTCLEWRHNEILVDSDLQDQEWAVVNTVQKRTRTVSESQPPDGQIRSKFLKIDLADIKSFKTNAKHHHLTIYNGTSEIIANYGFQHGNAEPLIGELKKRLKTIPSKRDKYRFCVIQLDNPEAMRLDTSFAELNLFQDSPRLWHFVKNFHNRPLEVTFETFAKITDYVYTSPEQRELDELQRELLQKSLTEYDNASHCLHGDYEMIPKQPRLPARKDFPRGCPLTSDQWNNLRNNEGKIEDIESVKLIIFRGGIAPNLRVEVWKYLLDYFPWDSTKDERKALSCKKVDEYYVMRLQWRRMTKIQESHFSDYRERKSLIEKDVKRTDRNLDFYSGDGNANIETLYDILMTYTMYNFDLGYVQGMSDLLSPILALLKNEVDAFWCFVGFMERVKANFDIDQAGMKLQLHNLHVLLSFVEPELANYLDKHDSGNMFFCFRWVLVWFKRELSLDDVMRFWEVMWTGLPCENFHLLVCVAILETEKQTLIENNYGFTEILRHINDLSGKLDIMQMVSKAEGILHQLLEAEHLTDYVRRILGLPVLEKSNNSKELDEIEESNEESSNNGCDDSSPDECTFERSIDMNYM